jgi:very-short-patch-repair endonuclease
VAPEIHQRGRARLWRLVDRQHGVVTKRQLLELGYTPEGIRHRLRVGRLHRLYPGVFAVGRPQLSLRGRWTAAVFACGLEAALSHLSAAAHWGIRPVGIGRIDVSVPVHVSSRPAGIAVHRRAVLVPADVTRHDGIPVTRPVTTLIDIAGIIRPGQLEAAINEADKLDLVDPESLRRALDRMPRRPGIAVLRDTLDRHTFALTDSELERLFLPIARQSRLPQPETGCMVNGYRTDFYWPDLGLVVETDGLRYHRTPAQQARDRVRDQTHAAAGLTSLRFTHAQVRFDPDYVRATLAAVVRSRLSAAASSATSASS